MGFRWRDAEPLASYDEWRANIATKDDAPGRSARSLAMAWAGPACVAGALAGHADLRGWRLESASVEAQTAFDSYPGGKRNHDLLLTGSTNRRSVVVSIESKADEPFGQSVGQYLDQGKKLKEQGKSTNAPDRLVGLVHALAAHRSLTDPPILALRYQLLTGVAGAVAAGVGIGASAAVFFVHEFKTDETSDALHGQNADDLHNLGVSVFDVQFPAAADPPWCVGPLPFAGNEDRLSPSVELYVAKATTDWRSDELASS